MFERLQVPAARAPSAARRGRRPAVSHALRPSRLAVGAADDPLEREADRFAGRVSDRLASSTTFAAASSGRIRRTTGPVAAPSPIGRPSPATSDDAVIRRQYVNSDYRLSTGVTRHMYVEAGAHEAPAHPVPLALPARAILHETMVRQDTGVALARRFRDATAMFPRTAGLSVALNASYRNANEVAAKQQTLRQTASTMVAAAPGRISVVKVLWQDGRANINESIRGEVPFAELRRHAAADPGSRALYAYLATQANTVWRRMGDDDLPFVNPNADDEVHGQLAKREGDDVGSLVSFSYDLTSESRDPAVQAMCTKVYKREAAAIAEVREQFGIKTYAIEPTTYYRGPANEDVGAVAWNAYEQHSDPHNKQIKEGASFAKSLEGARVIPHEYVDLLDPMPTSAGGRLNAFVAILLRYMNANVAVSDRAFMPEIGDALGAIDQSIWDFESLTRGSAWMGQDLPPNLVQQINRVIDKHLGRLIVELFQDVTTENRLRRAAA